MGLRDRLRKAERKGSLLRIRCEECGERFTRAHRELRESHDEQRHHAGIARWTLLGAAHFSPASPNVHVLSVPDTLPADDPEHPPEAKLVGLRGA
jgi:hypothetical protein